MKKIITGMALLLVTTLSAFSQTKNITVSGRVVEDTKEPAIHATVQLLLLPDSVQARPLRHKVISLFPKSVRVNTC